MRLAPGAMLGKTYRIVRWIGGGGMGDVYEVAHERLAGRYAAKVLSGDFESHPDAFTRFRREAMVTSGLRHPGIVQVIDFDRTDEGHPYMIMELLEGEELAAIIGRSAPLDLPRTLGIVEQIGSALTAAHEQGIVHRDLKPQNVFVSPLDRGRELVKILDFGISKAQVETRKLTRTAAVVGTPQYMAPEQAMGRGSEVDARADQFALAALTYELLTGLPAFSGESVVALIYQVMQVDPPPLATVVPHLPAGLDAVIRRGLAKQPGGRYGDVNEFVAALRLAAGAAGDEGAPRLGSRAAAAGARARAATPAALNGGTQKLPTTLSGSAAQVHGRTRQGRRTAMVFLLVAIATSAAGAAIWIRGARRRPDDAEVRGAAGEQPSGTSPAVAPPDPPPVTAPAPSSPPSATPTSPSSPSDSPPPATGLPGSTVAAPADPAVPPATGTRPASPERPKPDRRRRRQGAVAAPARGTPERPPRDELVNDL